MLTATLFIMGAPIQRSMAFWQLERDRVFETALTMLPLVALVFFDLLYYKKFKPLSLILAIGVFSFMWFRLYRPIFNSSWGEPIISGLTKVFLLS
jgi:hypothetical protein